jgi:hypothetical protein
MLLRFEIEKHKRIWRVNIWVSSDNQSRDYLEEIQYEKISQWCKATFCSKFQSDRVRRMSYADFWFKNKKDLDWFLLKWAGVDSNDI